MYVAAFLVHWHAFAITASPPRMEYALTFAVVLTILVLTGPGRIAFTPRL